MLSSFFLKLRAIRFRAALMFAVSSEINLVAVNDDRRVEPLLANPSPEGSVSLNRYRRSAAAGSRIFDLASQKSSRQSIRSRNSFGKSVARIDIACSRSSKWIFLRSAAGICLMVMTRNIRRIPSQSQKGQWNCDSGSHRLAVPLRIWAGDHYSDVTEPIAA